MPRKENEMEMEITGDRISVNGVTDVPETQAQVKAESVNGMEYVIVRTTSAGVFAGYLKSRDGKEVSMVNARRLWYWDGANSLSQIAVDGVSKPGNCKFPVEINVTLTEAIEIIPCSEKARRSIGNVAIWKQ